MDVKGNCQFIFTQRFEKGTFPPPDEFELRALRELVSGLGRQTMKHLKALNIDSLGKLQRAGARAIEDALKQNGVKLSGLSIAGVIETSRREYDRLAEKIQNPLRIAQRALEDILNKLDIPITSSTPEVIVGDGGTFLAEIRSVTQGEELAKLDRYTSKEKQGINVAWTFRNMEPKKWQNYIAVILGLGIDKIPWAGGIINYFSKRGVNKLIRRSLETEVVDDFSNVYFNRVAADPIIDFFMLPDDVARTNYPEGRKVGGKEFSYISWGEIKASLRRRKK